MAKANKPQQRQPAQPTAPKAAVPPRTPRPKTTSILSQSNDTLVFGRENFKWLFISIAIMVVGYLCMSGGSMPDANTWDESIIYSPVRIIVAPFLILLGLGVGVFAIFKKSPADAEN